MTFPQSMTYPPISCDPLSTSHHCPLMSHDQLSTSHDLLSTSHDLCSPDRGLLEMVDFERRIIPTFGVGDLVYDQPTLDTLHHFLVASKARKFVSAQWGFSSEGNVAQTHGIILLVCGPPGSGKTAIAHALGYELGQPIKVWVCVCVCVCVCVYGCCGWVWLILGRMLSCNINFLGSIYILLNSSKYSTTQENNETVPMHMGTIHFLYKSGSECNRRKPHVTFLVRWITELHLGHSWKQT